MRQLFQTLQFCAACSSTATSSQMRASGTCTSENPGAAIAELDQLLNNFPKTQLSL